MKAKSVLEIIGKTPVVKLNNSVREIPPSAWLLNEHPDARPWTLKSELWAKVEFFNPGGSVKDRIALKIVEEAEKRGDLKPGGTIVEATSGNTGAGLAIVAAIKGYRSVFVMPDKMSPEKINALRAYGSNVVVCPTNVEPESPDSYYSVARRLSKEIPNAILANQYHNPDNPRAHYETTGPEIWADFGAELDVYAAGLGTGGTFCGVTKFLKEKNPKLKAVGVDPVGSLYYGLVKEKKASPIHSYLIEGVGEDFMPSTMDISMVDDCVQVTDREGFAATRVLATHEGLLVGGSCGMAFYGAAQYLVRHEMKGGKPLKALVILPDSGSRYLSKVFNPAWIQKNNIDIRWTGSQSNARVEFLPTAKKIEGVE
jgi:cystathionine beta-synthase